MSKPVGKMTCRFRYLHLKYLCRSRSRTVQVRTNLQAVILSNVTGISYFLGELWLTFSSASFMMFIFHSLPIIIVCLVLKTYKLTCDL